MTRSGTLPVPLFCWAIYKHGEHMNRFFIRAWRKWSRVTDVLSDTIPGMRVVKAFNQEERETGRFNERNVDVTDEFNRIHQSWTTFWPALMLAVHGTTVAVWAFAVPRLLGTGGEATLTAGAFVSFLLYTTMFVGPIEIMSAPGSFSPSRPHSSPAWIALISGREPKSFS